MWLTNMHMQNLSNHEVFMHHQIFKLVSMFVLLVSSISSIHAAQINAAGASFPAPLYLKWFNEYSEQKGIKINYQSVGSGSGIRQTVAGTVDFGASDAPVEDEMLEKVRKEKKNELLHIPTVMGSVVISYKLSELKEPLNLTGEVLANIFLGKVKKWNDVSIQALNPNTTLPNKPIIVVHRSDGSGTTAIFTEFLAKVSPEWATNVKHGKSVRWPTGLGGKGNEGVSGLVKQSEGAIGYLEFMYARSNNLPVAAIKNVAGAFVLPSIDSVTQAAAAFKEIPDDFRMSITNPEDNKAAYPIAAFTYLLVYQKMEGEKGKNIKDFLYWAIDPNLGQSYANKGELSYAPLPESLVTKIKAKIDTIEVN